MSRTAFSFGQRSDKWEKFCIVGAVERVEEIEMLEMVYAHETWDKSGPSIFLAGPSPRKAEHYNWRPEALAILERLNYQGAVFIPLPRDKNWLDDYDTQVDWELEYLDRADVIAFWVPRDLINLPGFTTNVEYGLFLHSEKIVLGYPEGAPKMRYLDRLARKNGVPVTFTLVETLLSAVIMLTHR